VIEYLRNNQQFIVLLLLWWLAGMFGGPLVYLIVPATIFLIWRTGHYQLIFLGFLFILILSDSLQPGMGFAKTIKNLNILLIAGIFLASGNYFRPFNQLWKLYVPYFLVAIFCLMYAGPNLNTGIQKTLSYILLFLAVPNYISAIYKERGEAFLKDMFYFLLSIVVIGILIRFYNAEIAFSHGGRMRGIFGNPNGLGIFLILTFLFFSVTNHLHPEMYSKNEKLFIYAILFYSVYKTGSRSALLAIVFYLAFIRVYKVSPFLGFIAFLSSILGYELFLQNYATLIRALGLETVFRLDTLEEGSGRLIAWTFAWENIQQSMFLGKGISYDEYLMRSNFDYLSKQGHEGGVHNTYLIMWLNTGLIGLLGFLRGLLLTFIRAGKNTPIAFPVMFAVMFSINFEPWLAASLNPFTILFLSIATVLTGDAFEEQWNRVKSTSTPLSGHVENENGGENGTSLPGLDVHGDKPGNLKDSWV